jgi:hypothetical protein
MNKQPVVQVCDLTDFWCEYCPNRPKKVYLPLHKNVMNPARICEECAKDCEIVGWFDTEKEYYKALRDVQK